MTMNGALHPQADMDRLYATRGGCGKNGGTKFVGLLEKSRSLFR